MSLPIFLVVLGLGLAEGFLPVIMLHGFTGSYHDFDPMLQFIRKTHPGTPTYDLNLFNGDDSFTPLWKQVDGVYNSISSILSDHEYESYNLMCHSQGALICRVMLQKYSTPINTFISLAGPHMGLYGLFGSNWIEREFPGITTELAYLYFYRSYVQETYSLANNWNDPFHQAEYLRDVIFLPIANNQTANPSSHQYRDNFIQIEKLVLCGSPADGVIQPWQSTHFGFWAPDNTSLVPMEDQPLYIHDWLGLQVLEGDGRLLQIQPPGVTHMDWIMDFNVFQVWIEPHLD